MQLEVAFDWYLIANCFVYRFGEWKEEEPGSHDMDSFDLMAMSSIEKKGPSIANLLDKY